MKIKQLDGQIQRIERFIDLVKETHVAQATNHRGIVLFNRHLSFTNTIEGFEKLRWWMEGLQPKEQVDEPHHWHGTHRTLLLELNELA